MKRARLPRLISVAGLVAVAAWGASFVATRIALEAFSPYAVVALRLTLGALFLLAAVRVSRRAWLPEPADRPRCLLLGIILAVHLLLQAEGLQYTLATHAGWIIGFIPVTVAIGAHWLRQQRLLPLGWGGVALGTAGVLLVTWTEPPNFADAHFGDLLQVVSCFTWTAYTLLATEPLRRSGALRVTASAMTVAAALLVIVTLVRGPWPVGATLATWVAVAFLGLVCSGVAYLLWFYAVRRHGPSRTGALLYLEPFVTLATAAAIQPEPVTVATIGGGLLVLLGVWLVTRGTQALSRAE